MPNKSLGQHWLKDPITLSSIAAEADLLPTDIVLEIGPGLGTLTSSLLRSAKKVIAVEYDEALARKLPGQFPGKDLEVIHGDFLQFNLARLPSGYKLVANVPYYITGKIINHFLSGGNPPHTAVLLIQQEVAEKLAASQGAMTELSVRLQNQYFVHIGTRVHRSMFTPPPKVDSQTIILRQRSTPLVSLEHENDFLQIIRAGFSAPRKKLHSSLSGGLGITKENAVMVCEKAGVDSNQRAQELSILQWKALTEAYRVAH